MEKQGQSEFEENKKNYSEDWVPCVPGRKWNNLVRGIKNEHLSIFARTHKYHGRQVKIVHINLSFKNLVSCVN